MNNHEAHHNTGTIIPRWEWRTFGNSLSGIEEKIKDNRTCSRTRVTSEIYLLVPGERYNVKLRDTLLDIKLLVETDVHSGLEQWFPLRKYSFPLSRNEITEFMETLDIGIPILKHEELTYNQFFGEIVQVCEDLIPLHVKKKRFGFILGDIFADIAELTIEDTLVKTVSLESEHKNKLNDKLTEFNISGYPNISYPSFLKSLTNS